MENGKSFISLKPEYRKNNNHCKYLVQHKARILLGGLLFNFMRHHVCNLKVSPKNNLVFGQKDFKIKSKETD